MYRILNLSHLDLDGASAAAAIREAHNTPGQHVTTKFCGYHDIDKALLRGLTAKSGYNRIVLSDISWMPRKADRDEYQDNEERMLIEYEIPKAIQNYTDDGGELVLLDHHPRAVELHDYWHKYLHSLSICEIADANGVRRAGSEQAARYFEQVASVSEAKKQAMARLCELAGDYDVWRDPLGYGGLLAIGCELMDDPTTAMLDFITIANRLATYSMAGHSLPESVVRRFAEGTVLDNYANKAKHMLDRETAKAIESMVRHTDKITEIYCDNFTSLISMSVYNINGGVVIQRSTRDRQNVNKISLRCSEELDLDMTRIAARFGGGGHKKAAGIPNMRGRWTIDDVVAVLKAEVEGLNARGAYRG